MNIYQALAAIMRESDAIGKDQQNRQQGFKFRGIDDVYNSLHHLFAKHGVVTMPEILSAERQERTNDRGTVLAFSLLRMKYTFYAEDGSCISCVVQGEGMDSGDKATNKAMAIAHKYALIQALMIPTQDEKDPDSEVHTVKPKTQAPEKDYKVIGAEIKTKIGRAATQKDVDAIMANYKFDLEAMPEKWAAALRLEAEAHKADLEAAR